MKCKVHRVAKEFENLSETFVKEIRNCVAFARYHDTVVRDQHGIQYSNEELTVVPDN